MPAWSIPGTHMVSVPRILCLKCLRVSEEPHGSCARKRWLLLLFTMAPWERLRFILVTHLLYSPEKTQKNRNITNSRAGEVRNEIYTTALHNTQEDFEIPELWVGVKLHDSNGSDPGVAKILITIPGKLLVCNSNIFPTSSLSRAFIAVRSYATESKTFPASKGIFKVGLVGITVGAIVGTGYSVHLMNKPRAHIVNEQSFISQVKELPPIKPSRRVQVAGDRSDLKLTLFQYQTCPFCCKVRAFLDYYGISYDIIEVDPVLRQAVKWSPYKKVPILVAKTENGYQPLNDSTMIISSLASYLIDTDKDIREIVKCFPFIDYVDENGTNKHDIMNKYFLMLNNQSVLPNEKKNTEERNWRKWADDVLVHTLSPNVYRNREEAIQAFRWFSEVGEWEKKIFHHGNGI
ncbi:hypothetical protein NQ317_011357 [Molorchus minor]|uniref:Glutaredoxin domain-containing protein n=1 Tax=Molorchus minor TaxID=1323400 RepID=A0ABQ9JCG9_9CUCU|nr:hypothetical protein NQ317_011357 [Molorchus minor]